MSVLIEKFVDGEDGTGRKVLCKRISAGAFSSVIEPATLQDIHAHKRKYSEYVQLRVSKQLQAGELPENGEIEVLISLRDVPEFFEKFTFAPIPEETPLEEISIEETPLEDVSPEEVLSEETKDEETEEDEA